VEYRLAQTATFAFNGHWGATTMARKTNISSKFFATIPAIAALVAGVASALQSENVEKIKTFFSNPLNAGAITVYAAAILAIVTAIFFQLALSARITDRREEPRSESPSEAVAIDMPEPPQLTPEQRASRERDRHLSIVRVAFTRNRRRMIDETERIRRNGFLNLMIGILFSVVALGILGYPLIVQNPAPAADWINIVERFAPRMSVGILIQLIGFFFLRLYVAGENELHYIRNEITNLESRLIGYNAAAVSGDNAAMTDFIGQLVRTERNFKLKKGERTLYRVDESYNDIGQLLKAALAVRRPKANEA
jgi:hypothetical protein